MTGEDPRGESGGDRGQAYTLESLIASLLLVTAVLFALQSVVILPSSAGTLDRDVQAQLYQESTDTLVTAANDGELSRMARYWEEDTPGNWTFADDPGYAGAYEPGLGGYRADLLPVQDLGEALNHTIREGNQYNVVLAYDDGNGNRETRRLVYQGTPGDDVITASYTITLTDDQLVTGPEDDHTTLAEADASDNAPIPNVDDSSSPVYNVVEVRLVLW